MADFKSTNQTLAGIFKAGGKQGLRSNYTVPPLFKNMENVNPGYTPPSLVPTPKAPIESSYGKARRDALAAREQAMFERQQARQEELKNSKLVKGADTFIDYASNLEPNTARMIAAALGYDKQTQEEVAKHIEMGTMIYNPMKVPSKILRAIRKVGKAAESRSMMGDFKELQGKLDEATKIEVPNAMNAGQTLRAISQVPEHGAPFIRTFAPKDVFWRPNKNNYYLAGTGSHHTGLGAGMNVVAKGKGDFPVPIMSETYDLKGPSFFGTGEGQEYLASSTAPGAYATSNAKALDMIDGLGMHKNFYMPEGGIIFLDRPGSSLPPTTRQEMDSEFKRQVKNAELSEILAGISQNPRMIGDPEFMPGASRIELGFTPANPFYDHAQLENYFQQNEIPPEGLGIFRGTYKDDDMTGLVYKALGIERPMTKYGPGALHDSPELMDKLGSLVDSNDPVMRWIGQQIESGNIVAKNPKGNINKLVGMDLDDEMYGLFDKVQDSEKLKPKITHPSAHEGYLTAEQLDEVRKVDMMRYLLGGEKGMAYEPWMDRFKIR